MKGKFFCFMFDKVYMGMTPVFWVANVRVCLYCKTLHHLDISGKTGRKFGFFVPGICTWILDHNFNNKNYETIALIETKMSFIKRSGFAVSPKRTSQSVSLAVWLFWLQDWACSVGGKAKLNSAEQRLGYSFTHHPLSEHNITT